MTVTVRPLESSDLDWVAALYGANARDAVPAEERASRGFVQGQMSPEMLGGQLDGPGAFVAVDDATGEGVGALLTHEPGRFPPDAPMPPAQAVRVAQEANLPAPVLYGPAVVAESARGQGVLRALATAAFAHLRGRYSHAIAFMETENEVSATAHQRIGFRPIGEFTAKDRPYLVVVHDLT